MINRSRSSGILMHISSLPGPFGVGVLGKEALAFIDLLHDCGFKNWQILPLNPVDEHNSPYKSSSAFAGNFMFIDPRNLVSMELVSQEEIEQCFLNSDSNIANYEFTSKKMLALLKLAFTRINNDLMTNITQFSIDNKWLEPYSLFMSVKDTQKSEHWYEWTNGYNDYEYCRQNCDKFKTSISFWKFVQYIFYKQWNDIKSYANSKGISLIGDIPFYVSLDSADVWSNTCYFDLNQDDYTPNKVAGVPPDYFSEDGQLWGNPLFNWTALKENDYSWWMDRFRFLHKNFDIIRIDHFRAFASYWAVPYGNLTARDGEWLTGPFKDFFDVLNNTLPEINLVAEDLGCISDDVRELLAYTKLPGMKVMEFGFEDTNDGFHLPHNFEENSVAYLGTHDCNTLLGYLSDLDDYKRAYALEYIGFQGDNWSSEGCDNKVCQCAIETLWRSNSILVVVALQDMCGLGSKYRMNIPGVEKNNWIFRIRQSQLENIDKGYYTRINEMFKR